MNKLFTSFAVLLLVCGCFKAEKTKLIINTENGPVTYYVETASTIKELEKGLMDRDTLARDSGMLFDLSQIKGTITAMWMKDTKISLDMIFLTKEGDIFWIKENAEPYSEELIIAPFPAAAVLEVNSGDVAKNHIKVGQRIEHELFKNLSKKQTEKVSEEKMIAE